MDSATDPDCRDADNAFVPAGENSNAEREYVTRATETAKTKARGCPQN